MIRIFNKLIVVGAIIGIGTLLNMLLVPILTRFLVPTAITNIATFDSQLLLVVAILGFGLNVTATRDVSVEIDWVPVANSVASARLMLSILLSVIGLVSVTLQGNLFQWLPFVLAPVIALNIDFVLYGRAKPIAAALASFIRQSVPIVLFIIVSYWFSVNEKWYPFLSIVLVLVSGYFVSKVLSLNYIPKINLSAIRKYTNVFHVGLAALLVNFQRIGFLGVFSGFFNASDSIMIFGVLKIYLGFVAIRRLFIQTFYSQLEDKIIEYVSNSVIIVIALTVFTMCFLSTSLMSSFLYGDHANVMSDVFVRLLGLLILCGSFFPCSDAILLRLNGDKAYVLVNLIGFLVFFFSSIVMWVIFDKSVTSFLYALIFSELIMSLGYRYSIYKIMHSKLNCHSI